LFSSLLDHTFTTSLQYYHLFGLTALFLASKLEDLHPIPLDELVEKAAVGAFDRN
jgi:hypothetical protein